MEKKSEKVGTVKTKEPIYKQVWFWAVVALIAMVAIVSFENKTAGNSTANQNDTVKSPAPPIKQQEFEILSSTITSAVLETSPSASVEVHNYYGGVEIDIVSTDDLTYFATDIDDLITVCEQNIDLNLLSKISFSVYETKGREKVLAYEFIKDYGYSETSDFYGFLLDYRSGDASGSFAKTYDELLEKFPASKIENQEKERLSEDDLKIYNEVWAALDAEPNRPEEDIFEELAPRYGMTRSELKQFILDAMEKVYRQ